MRPAPPVIVRQFLRWAETAPAQARAQGASALAQAYVDGEFDANDSADAVEAMTALLDDPAPAVRRALALVLHAASGAPHAVIAGLAADSPDIAAPVLEHSPVLSTAELVDAAAVGEAAIQAAVARRREVPAGLAAALAEVAGVSACTALCANPGATIPAFSLSRMVERFGDDAGLREAMLGRPDLPPGLRYDLVAETARHLQAFVAGCGWLAPERAARLARDAVEGACMTVAARAAELHGVTGAAALARHLRRAGALTPALVLRAAVCGNVGFVAAALSELAGVPFARVSGILRAGPGLAFDALCGKAGLPPALQPAFAAACAGGEPEPSDGVTPQRERIERALTACGQARRAGDLHTVTALLRRLDAEAARDRARGFARTVREPAPLLLLPRLTAADRSLPLPDAA